MSPAHIAVIVVGVVSLTEAIWGVTDPRGLQNSVRKVMAESPSRSIGMGVFFLLLAGILWLVISPERRVVDWALVVISWLFVGGGLVNFKPGGLRVTTEFLILKRTPGTLRLIYALELICAVMLIGIGLFRL